jgi:hypothetical protein
MTGQDCSAGVPADCEIDCAVVFMAFFQDCQTLMTTMIGDSGVAAMGTFNDKCIGRHDVPTLLNMIKSMTEQGCSADATLDALEGENANNTFAGADGLGHFSVEVGQCDFATLDAKIAATDQACCNPHDAGDACASGSPTLCDEECAIAYVPFYEDCQSLLGGSGIGGDPNAMSYESLYGLCMQNARRGASGLLRSELTLPLLSCFRFLANGSCVFAAMHMSSSEWDSDTCPIAGAL